LSQEAERVYTINLGKVWLSPNNQRSKRAINMIREFASHHMKTEQIKIDQELSQAVWKRGIRSPPRKIRVKMAKTDEGYVLVSTYEEEITKETEKPKDQKKKKAAKTEEKPEQKEEPKVADVKPKEKPEQKVEQKPKKEETKPKEKQSKTKEEAKPKKEEAKKEAKKSETKKPAKKEKSK
jgi:large subunit ribosomal protein L31e